MANFVPDSVNAAAERGAPEHTPGAQDAQAFQMLDNGHQDFMNPYGDVYEAGSVVASNEAEPWLFPPATAPTAIAEADEAGHAELELHLQRIRHAAQHTAEQLAPLVKSPPPPPPPKRPPLVPADVSGVPPAPSGVPPAGREAPPQPPAEPRADVAAADDADGASEHVLLTKNDLPELRQLVLTFAHVLGDLHDEARAFTNKFANADHEAIGVQANLTTEWPNWKLYIASHKQAAELIGPGVKAFTAELIDGTKDPNRGGRLRLDLVIRHTDNAYWRLHPGSTRKTDAKPRYFPASAPEPAAYEPASAPEPAAYEWCGPGPAGVFSSDRIKLVPARDRFGGRYFQVAVSARENPEHPLKIFDLQVPLFNDSTQEVQKTVEIIQQERRPLVVTIDRSCLFAFDYWNGMPVGSPQDLDATCPCCGKTQRRIDDENARRRMRRRTLGTHGHILSGGG